MPTKSKFTCTAQAVGGTRVLEELGLTRDEVAALKRQGFVSAEPRRKNIQIFKLRFRMSGRQQVRYLGCDPAVAAAVERELRGLQRAKHVDKKLRSRNRQASEFLRT